MEVLKDVILLLIQLCVDAEFKIIIYIEANAYKLSVKFNYCTQHNYIKILVCMSLNIMIYI